MRRSRDRPFTRSALSRKIKNSVATSPVRGGVRDRAWCRWYGCSTPWSSAGFKAIISSDVVDQVAGRGATGAVRRRRVPRDLRDDRPGGDRGGAGGAAGHLGGDLPGRVRPRPVRARSTTFMVDILAGVPSIVAALFIFALWIATIGLPAERVRGVAGAGAADAAGRGAQHRGNAQAGSRRTARGVVRAGHSEMEDHRADRRSHRAARHHQRHHAGAGPGDRRDGAGAGAGRLRQVDQLTTCSTATWRRCRC